MGEAKKLLTCAFCQGTGKDPFDLLSKLADCPVCGNKGKVEVYEPITECPFCKGTGVCPHSRLTCSICRGKGCFTRRSLDFARDKGCEK